MKRRKFIQECSKGAILAASAGLTRLPVFADGAVQQGIAKSHGGAVPEVSNRAPVIEEIGYLPREGATVDVNPPALAWLPEPGAEAYAVELARDPEFRRGGMVIGTPYVLYTHTETLAPGTWWWRYACRGAGGARSAWSKARSFTIPVDAQPFPLPSEAVIKERLPRVHPRLMMRPEEVAPFRKTCQGAQKERWERFRADAEEQLKRPLTPEPAPYPHGKEDPNSVEDANETRRNYKATIEACTAAETLALCYRLTGESRYGQGARKWLLQIASWDPTGPTSLEINDECGMPILCVTSRAYDWAYDALSESDREKMRAMIRVRGELAYNKLHGATHEQKAYDSHQGRLWHFMAEAAIAYYGEVPEAKRWLDYAFMMFWGWYPAFGDADGGWAQGLNYWRVYMLRSTWWLDALRAAMKIDGTEKPFYRHVGDFPIYVAPPGGALVGFGDYGEEYPDQPPRIGYFEPGIQGLGSVDAYFARARSKPEWQWYAEKYGRDAFPPTAIGLLRALRGEPHVPKAKPPADWPKAKWFRGVGWVTLHTNLVDGKEDVQVIMRSSQLGNISHSHANQNAIVLGAYGSPLLVNTGIRPWWDSPFSKEWYFATKANNAIEINGKGQPRTSTATGKMIVFQPGEAYDYVVGDASPSYGREVERYRRHLLFLKPDVLVVMDEVMANTLVSVSFLLHGRAPFAIDAPAGRIALTFERAALAGFLLAPGGLDITQTDQYTLRPELGNPPPEWHLTAKTRRRQSLGYVVAVLGIGRAGSADAIVTDVKHVIDENTVTLDFLRSGKPSRIAFDVTARKVRVG